MLPLSSFQGAEFCGQGPAAGSTVLVLLSPRAEHSQRPQVPSPESLYTHLRPCWGVRSPPGSQLTVLPSMSKLPPPQGSLRAATSGPLRAARDAQTVGAPARSWHTFLGTRGPAYVLSVQCLRPKLRQVRGQIQATVIQFTHSCTTSLGGSYCHVFLGKFCRVWGLLGFPRTQRAGQVPSKDKQDRIRPPYSDTAVAPSVGGFDFAP